MSDIVTLNGYKIKDEKAVRSYESVAQMKADTKLKEGYHVKTKGYYEPNDGGAAAYIITDTSSLTDYQETLENGLYATLIVENGIANVKQLGAYGDNSHDDTTVIQNAVNKFDKIFIPNGTYIISDTIILPKNHKIQGENMDSTIIQGTCSGKYIYQYMNSYDYQSFNGLITQMTITSPDALVDKPKGIDFTNGSVKLTNLKLIRITNPINAGNQYKDNIYLENITATYSEGYSASDYFIDINCNCDNLYINQLRTGFSREGFTDDIQHTMRIRNTTGGTINNLILGNNLLLDRCNNLQVNSVHCENDVGAKFKISNSFVTMNNILKYKNPNTTDFVITSDSRGNNCNVTLNNVELSFYPANSSASVPSVDVFEKDIWSVLITHNIKCRLQHQKIDNIHTNILFQPKQLNPYNDNINLPDRFNIKTIGASSSLGAYYPTNSSLNWSGGDYKKYIFILTDSPTSNKYVNKTNAITIENSCYFHLRNGDYKAKNCYCIIYGSDDNGTTYTRKWIIPLDDLGIIFTNGATFNLSTYETNTDYSTEISGYILCTNVNYENENYKIKCDTLVNTTYNVGDEITIPSAKYIYTSNGIQEFTLI